jgi:uncharacterized membrane protein YbaN (DUF454 family)
MALRFVLALFGIVSVLVGIAGVLLPVIPGIPFLAVGYFLLVPEFPWLGIPVVKAMRRWPKFRRSVPKRFRRRPRSRHRP